MSNKWNLDNVLPKYKADPNNKRLYGNFGKASEPSKHYAEQGAGAALPGLSKCPWCENNMELVSDDSYLAVCLNNLEHRVQWMAWGG
jgi:hypothetical protein